MTELDLSSIEEVCRPRARKAFKEGDGKAFATSGYSSRACLTVVADNVEALAERGIFEQALIAGYTGGKTNHAHIETEELEELFFEIADRNLLRDCGVPLEHGSHQIYRGVSGEFRINGFSWTSSLEVACSFAHELYGPAAVYHANVHTDDVLCYKEERGEQEFIVRPVRCEQLAISPEEIRQHSKNLADKRTKDSRAKLAELRRNRGLEPS